MRSTLLRAALVIGVTTVAVERGVAAPTPVPVATAMPGETERWSDKRLFHVRYESTPSPVPLLVGHTWTIAISDAGGNPVREARVTVLGGMPAHAHGLPTTPVVTELGAGRYRIEGLKFHMPGAWVVAFRIKASAGTDAVSFALELP